MSGVLNDCDALLQAASVRILNPDSAFINLTASAPGFHINGAGAVDLATVTIMADLIALDGDVVFTGQGVTLSNVKARSVDATYVNGTGIVTATVVTNGETFARSYVIPVLRDGATGGSAKVLTLSPTEQVFKITKAGANSPDSITLTASGQNLGGSPSFTIPIGTATLTAGANASQKILTFANMATDSVTVQVAQDGQVDRVTIAKLREGLDGVSPVAGFLTNESVSVAATNAGAVGSLAGAGGTFRVLDGITDVTGNAAVAYSVAAETGVDVSIAANGVYTIASLSADTGTATLRAVYKGVTIDRVYTIVKARAGADGTAPVYVEVSTSGGQMFSRATAAASFAPTSITLSATVAGGAATAYQWQYWTGSAWTAISSATASSYAVASGSFTGSRVFRVAATVGGTTYLDEITLVQVTGGTDGVDAITGVLSNELVALPANSNGVVSSYTGAECTLRVYKGINEDGGWAFGFAPASSATALAYTTSGGTATVTGLASGVDAAFIDIIATKPGHSSITKRFNVTKSRAGASVTGARGAGHYYVAGSSWSDVVAQAACPGGPVTNDVVTISSSTFVMEKRWTGSAWVENGVVINGKLIAPDSILASAIDARGLVIRDAQGNIVISAGGLQPGFEAPDTKNSDVTLATLGAPAAALSRVAIGTMHSGGSGDVRFVKNQNVNGTANDGEIRVLGTTFYHPDGVKRAITDKREVSTPFEDVTTADPFFIIYTDVSPVTRFGTSGFLGVPAAAISPDFFAAVYNLATGVWQAVDNANVRTTFTPLATDCIVAIGRKYTSNAAGAGIDMLSSLLSVNTNLPADGATVGAPSGTFVAGVAATSVASAITNFNASNDRNAAAVVAPTIATDGTAVDHVIRTDGGADISFEWLWAGTEGDIDGFLVYVVSTSTVPAYAFGTAPAYETVYTVPADKRAFILYGAAANLQTTFGVQAYRSVDKDVAAGGVIRSVLVKPSRAEENPYRPSTSVAFAGDITGTIGGTAATTVVANAAAGKSANDAIPDINTAIATKLSRTSASSLAATITVSTGGSILAGTTSNGAYMSPTGLYGVRGGVVKFSIPIDGDPTFGGKLTAPSGTLGSLRIDGGAITSGGFTDVYEWPLDTSKGGCWFGGGGILLGNGRPGSTMGYFQVTGGGNIYAPGLKLENSQLTLTSPVIISPIFEAFTASLSGGAITSSGANGSRSLGSRQIIGSGGKLPYRSFSWTVTDLEGNSAARTIISGENTDTVSVSASGTNAATRTRITGTITDANGLTASASFTTNATFGAV